jgi:hypothetical protein
MIILKQGVPPQERKWLGTCRTCKSELEAKADELYDFFAGDQRDPGKRAKGTCPVCQDDDVNFYEEAVK